MVDTDLFIKLKRNQPISAVVQTALHQCAPRLFVSVVSIWQMLLRERAGLQLLPHPPLMMLAQERSLLGLQSLALDEACLQHLHQLSDQELSSFDQLLICQALQSGLKLASERPCFCTPQLSQLGLQLLS